LSHVSVDVTHDKQHAQDAEHGSDRKVDVFRRVIRLTGDLSEDQCARLMEIADRCPVHRTLEQSSRVETRRAPG
jgi:putative redox protein